MANGYLGDKAVKLPNMFQAPGQALAARIEDKNRLNERKFELDYRNQKDREAEDWRKLNLIQDLTDISKYQTGSDVADAIGNRKVNEIFQKYTQSAGAMSPAELQANIQKDMSVIIGGMSAAKQELTQADDQIKLLKQKYPSIDTAQLASDYRNEILNRRISGSDFVNPLTVGQSNFDVLNPEFLSKYVTGNKNLTSSITNPQGLETMKVMKGSPNAYTEYSTKIPFWKKENIDRTALKNGFMSGSTEPKLEIKASVIPGVKSVNGQPFMAMDEDVYKRFQEDEGMNLELTAATRQKYKDYDNLSPEEKSLAKRNVLYDKIKELDQSDYYPSDVKSPPRISIRNSSGGSTANAKGSSNINDIYSRIESDTDEAFNNPKGSDWVRGEKLKGAASVQDMDIDASNLIVDFVNKSYPNKGEDDNPYKASELFTKKGNDGKIHVYDEDGNSLGTLPKTGVNLKVQPDVKAKRAVVQQGDAVSSSPTYSIKGKLYSEKELLNMGYTKEQIAPYKQK